MNGVSIATRSNGEQLIGGEAAEPDPPESGYDHKQLRSRRRDTVTIKVAGSVGEVIGCGGPHDRRAAEQDLEFAHDLALWLEEGNVSKAWERVEEAISEAGECLREQRDALTALAEALLKRTELTGDEVRQIIAIRDS
jgi:hypothetical protein